MKPISKKRIGFLSAVLVFAMVAQLSAGDLTPPAGPDSVSSAMFMLEDLHQRLSDGTTGTKRSGAFQEPSSGPTSGTMHTLNDVMGLAPQKDDIDGAQDAGVLTGKKYWGVNSSQWGLRTGSMANVGIQNVTPVTSDVTIAQGYHDGTGKVVGDADLVTGNIKAGTNLFGVTGNSNVVNTSSGDAATAEIRQGEKAWVDGQEVIGTLVGGTTCSGTLSPLGRWCDNGDGTITDTTTGLFWYVNDSYFWGAAKAYCSIAECGVSIDRPCLFSDISTLSDGSGYSLFDGSEQFDWRLPTVNEMLDMASGVEAISPSTQYFFKNIQTGYYWTGSMAMNPIPMQFMKVQMPETLGYGVVSTSLYELHYALAVRGAL